jgi:NADH-quinone oxidoreductase subunit B
MHDLFGVWFEGNPGMGMRFLIAPDTPENPLRKDFRLEEEVYTEKPEVTVDE